MPANCVLSSYLRFIDLFGQVIIGYKSACETIIDETYLSYITILCEKYFSESVHLCPNSSDWSEQ